VLTCRSPEEHAAYKLLLDFIHSHGADLPRGEPAATRAQAACNLLPLDLHALLLNSGARFS
jgi:hypothetical protein